MNNIGTIMEKLFRLFARKSAEKALSKQSENEMGR